MKILLLSDPSSSHTIKWANSLHEAGLEILVFGLSRYNPSDYKNEIPVEAVPFLDKLKNKSDGNISKLLYLKSLRRLKKCIYSFRPDIIHSHYASSYGLLGALTNFHPFIISVWGSDIYNFPGKSIIHKKIIEYSLSKADKIFSTSKSMVSQTRKFTNKEIIVTPFGIDVEKFKPMKVDSIFGPNDFVIGTIKTLEKQYGIEYLIKAFKLIKDRFTSIPLKLLIVGRGSLENHLKKLVSELNLSNDTVFTGYIAPDSIPKYHNMLDIYLSLSVQESESFGVAVLEASACEKPVIVSNIGGLPEIIENNITGFVVPVKGFKITADVIEKLFTNNELRKKMGVAGRERVIRFYHWKDNVNHVLNIYSGLIKNHL